MNLLARGAKLLIRANSLQFATRQLSHRAFYAPLSLCRPRFVRHYCQVNDTSKQAEGKVETEPKNNKINSSNLNPELASLKFGYGFDVGHSANQFVKDVQEGNQTPILTHIAKYGKGVRDKYGNTPLHWAAASGQAEMIELLVREGVDVNATNFHGAPPLFYAAYNGSTEAIAALVENGASLKETDYGGHTALHYAAWNGTPDTIYSLTAYDLSINTPSLFGRTPLMYSTPKIDNLHALLAHGASVNLQDVNGTNALHFAVMEGDKESIKVLADAGASLDTKSNSGGSPLTFAAAKGMVDAVTTLCELKANVDHKGHNGVTPLMLATMNGHVECVQVLIEKGKADVNAKSDAGVTALLVAVRGKQEEVAKILLSNGADMEQVDTYGDSSLVLAAKMGEVTLLQLLARSGATLPQAGKYGAMHAAAEYGHVNILQELQALGVSIDVADESGATPLVYASGLGHPQCVEWLLKKGANAATTEQLGRTPLHYATDVRSAELLVGAGLSVDAKDLEDNTPLAIAAASERALVMEVLVKMGAKTGEMDLQGRTPLHLAIQHGKVNSVEKLISLGVSVEQPNKNGDPPLITALRAKNNDVVKKLLQLGASAASVSGRKQPTIFHSKDVEAIKILLDSGLDLNSSRNDRGDTFLHYLCTVNEASMAMEVVKMGGDVNAKNSFGATPLYYACNNLQLFKDLVNIGGDVAVDDMHGNSLLHFCAQNAANTDVLQELLKMGFNIEMINKGGHTPLFSATAGGKFEAVKILLDQGANVTARDNQNNSLLHFAMFQRDPEVVVELVKRGCEKEAQNGGGWTPLVAAAYDNPAYVPLLVKLGCSLETKDNEGNTPLLKLVKEKRVEGVKALVKEGAQKVVRDAEGLLAVEIAEKNNAMEIVQILSS